MEIVSRLYTYKLGKDGKDGRGTRGTPLCSGKCGKMHVPNKKCCSKCWASRINFNWCGKKGHFKEVCLSRKGKVKRPHRSSEDGEHGQIAVKEEIMSMDQKHVNTKGEGELQSMTGVVSS